MKVKEAKYNSPTIDWMPEIPNHWKVIRIKNLFYEVDERSMTGREDLLSVSHYTGVTLRKEGFDDDVEITNARTLVGYKIVDVGDLVINIMLAWNGSLGVSRFKGITSPAYCVFRLKENYNPEYFGYLFSTALFKGEFKKSSTGIIDSRLRLYSDDFFRIFSFVPPKDEQDKIVKYIKENSAKIQHFIETKQRFIELLKEQRQNITTNAVTKGIDKNVKLKSSGVSWLGDIPEHWEIRRLKTIVNLKSGETITAELINETGDFPVYGGNGLRGYTNKFTNDGDFVLIGRQGALCGNINYAYNKFWASEHAVVVYPKVELDFFWLGETLRTMNLNQYSMAAAQPGLSVENIKILKLPFPPLQEQQEIVKQIKSETHTLNIAIDKAEREVELMEEYREAIINEVVTGKII
ncbi:MAG: restriction endonuclease subunit S [Bacteroidetes bacterium]|nr:restriction endonuclease subunit S [Bacteroidota bacterium]